MLSELDTLNAQKGVMSQQWSFVIKIIYQDTSYWWWWYHESKMMVSQWRIISFTSATTNRLIKNGTKQYDDNCRSVPNLLKRTVISFFPHRPRGEWRSELYFHFSASKTHDYHYNGVRWNCLSFNKSWKYSFETKRRKCIPWITRMKCRDFWYLSSLLELGDSYPTPGDGPPSARGRRSKRKIRRAT